MPATEEIFGVSDIVWVALISGGFTLIASIVAQLISAQSARRAIDRSESQSEQQWQRSEARRKAEIAREDELRLEQIERDAAQREQERRAALLQQCWEYVLESRTCMRALLAQRLALGKTGPMTFEKSPVSAAARACAFSLLGLADIYPYATIFYRATAAFQVSIEFEEKDEVILVAAETWRKSLSEMEKQVAILTGVPAAPPEETVDIALNK